MVLRNKLINTLTLVLVIIILGCCAKNNNDVPVNLKYASLVDVDSIKMKYESLALLLADIRHNKLLYFDFFNKDVLISDLHGSAISAFNQSSVLNGFGKHLLGACFLSDTSLAILSEKGYYVYDLKGNPLQTYYHNFDLSEGVHMNSDMKLKHDTKHKAFLSLLTTSTDLHVNDKAFYDQIKHITVFNYDSEKYHFKLGFDTEGSYLQKQYFTHDFAPYFDAYGDSLAVIYPRDPIIYIYGLGNFRKAKSFKTTPENFSRTVSLQFGEEADPMSPFLEYSNSTYCKIFIKEDTVLAFYNSGLPRAVLQGLNSLEKFQDTYYKDQRTYLQVFINGKKVTHDLELPKEFPLPYVFSNGRIFFGEQEKWRKRKDGFKRFISCKLNIISKPTEGTIVKNH